MSAAIIADVADFLARVPAFRLLEASEVHELAAHVEVDYAPAGATILAEGDPPSEFLKIVVSGGVKVTIPAGDAGEFEVDYRSEGAAIGYLSLFSGDLARANVTAVEETLFYLIPRERFLALLERNPVVREFFTRTFMATYMDKIFSDLRDGKRTRGSREQRLFSTPLGELITRVAVTAEPGISIRDAARLMSNQRISSLVIAPEGGVPVGIVTDRDLRDKVVAVASDSAAPVGAIMSPLLVTADPTEICFEALVKMIRNNVHHLPVLEEGRLRGVLTNHDLMMLQGASPISVVREIDDQRDLEGLCRAARSVDGMIAVLLDEGAGAGNLTRVITEINDRLVRKVLELAAVPLGPAPVEWCWIVFGSEGRREQTFKTDQDNAIVYADPADDEQARAAQAWFASFTSRVRDALERCGFPPCPGGYMAANPEWCRPLREWKRAFSLWIANPDAEAVLRSQILFDFRPLCGAEGLATQLRAHLAAAIERAPAFLGFLANQIVKNPPPLGFLHQLVVEKEGEHKDRLNLKLKAIAPIVDLARLFALEKGISETGTLDRLRALRESNTAVGRYGEELEQAFEFLMLLRIHHQQAQVAAGREPDNFIDPNELSALERKTAREAFGLVAKVQGHVMARYRASLW